MRACPFHGAIGEQAASIAVALTRLSRDNRWHVKGLGGGMAELNVDFGSGYEFTSVKTGEMLVSNII